MHVVVHQGGAFKGVFGVPIMKALFEERVPDLMLGVSVGAINGVAACSEKWPELEELWLSIDDNDPSDGVNGYLEPSHLNAHGIYNLNPLRKKLERHIKLADIKVPFGCGAVASETGRYHTFFSDKLKTTKGLINAVLASASIAGLMEPIHITLDGRKYTWIDGCHLHSIPVIPSELRAKVKSVDMILTNSITPTLKPREVTNNIVEEILWALNTQFVVNQESDLALYKQMVEENGTVIRIFSPKEDLGDALNASNDVINERWKKGEESLRHPVFWKA